mgnify:CR=1 FL=1
MASNCASVRANAIPSSLILCTVVVFGIFLPEAGVNSGPWHIWQLPTYSATPSSAGTVVVVVAGTVVVTIVVGSTVVVVVVGSTVVFVVVVVNAPGSGFGSPTFQLRLETSKLTNPVGLTLMTPRSVYAVPVTV